MTWPASPEYERWKSPDLFRSDVGLDYGSRSLMPGCRDERNLLVSRKKSRGLEADLVTGETRMKVLLHLLQTGSRFSQRWAWRYETKGRGGACPFQRQKSCRRAKVAADGSLRRVHRCTCSPWSCTETAINCFDSVDAALGKVSKVFADYIATNLVEILAFWIAVSVVCVVVGILK